MILLIDNYDSFTYNLERYLLQLGQQVNVVRNDIDQLESLASDCQAMIISPGPKAPRDAGRCIEIVGVFAARLPILGICLGHQVIYEAFGGRVVRATRPVHGRASAMQLEKCPLFEGIANNSRFARYHSLVGDPATLPSCLRVTAWSDSGEIMAVSHRSYPTFGIQFHPESVLSSTGFHLLSNFLRISGLPCPNTLPPNDYANSPEPLCEADDQATMEIAREQPVVLPRLNRSTSGCAPN